MNLLERSVRYMLKVECKYCGSDVYPHEDDARHEAQHWIEHGYVGDIDGLRGEISRTCDHCAHILSKDD